MKVNIITDSASDFSKEAAKKLDVVVLPLPISFGEETFLDGIDLSHKAFFEKLIETDVLPKTSQISPYEYKKAFDNLSEDEEAICITISSKLSGCFQSANIASADMDNVFVVDSANVCVGQQILVEYATRLRDQGLCAKDIVAELEKAVSRIRIVALLDTLEYLKKGGRISPTVAFAGAMLSIKPVVAVIDGEVALLGKARGSKNGNNKLMELIQKEGGINFDMPFALGYAGLSTDLLDKYIEDSKSIYEGHTDNLPINSIGCAIGTHVGPGAIAVAFFV